MKEIIMNALKFSIDQIEHQIANYRAAGKQNLVDYYSGCLEEAQDSLTTLERGYTVVRKEDDSEHVVLMVEFNLGKLSIDDEHTINLPPDVKGMIHWYRQLIIDTIRNGGDASEAFDIYDYFKLLDSIGVQHHPIKRNLEGLIEGLKKSSS